MWQVNCNGGYTQLGEYSMFPLLVHRVVSLGFVWLGAALLPNTAVFAQESTQEHILFQAIRRGDIELLSGALRAGTPPDIRASDGTTPLMAAALHGSAQMVSDLLDAGADPRAVSETGVTALLWGAWDANKVRLLLQRGADPNARSALGNTALMVAAGSPTGSAAVEQLLEAGADITLRNKGGRPALRFAAGSGDVQSVCLLLEKAKSLNQLPEVVSAAGPSLAIAASDGFPQIVELLLAHGADQNQANGTRGHGLNAALLAGHTGIAKELLAHGSDLDNRVNPGEVPTTLLAAYTELDDPSMLQMLSDHSADFRATSHDRETALTWARLRGHRQMINELEKVGSPEGEMPSKPAIQPRPLDLHAGNQTRLIAEAVQKSIDLLQLSSDTFLDVRNNCVSCHHQNLPGVAIGWARDRGFHFRKASTDRVLERQVASWLPRVGRSFELDSPYPVPPTFLGYGMWMFAELGYRPDELTRAVTWYLAATQQSDGHWVAGMLRPPLGGDVFQATALAMRSLQLYPLPGREQELAERIGRARSWLESAEPRTHENVFYRTLGLSWAGKSSTELGDEMRRLLASQREDGGWAQLPGLDSDAWATGQSLIALHVACGLPITHPAYQRGIEMLLRTQGDDGSWYVQTRSWPFQPYFESKFPYGRDQWISAPATAWAVMALVLSIKPQDLAQLHMSAATDIPASSAPPSRKTSDAQLVPPTTRIVDFSGDIKPLLARSCLGCHGDKEPKSNFSLTSQAALLRGGDSDLPAIIPGASVDSPLIRFAAGLVEKMEMPPVDSRDKFPPLSAEELALLRGWIDQGAHWPAELTPIAK
jgi:ankyrin repeat protein